MNIKNIKMLCAAILSINLIQSPVQATISNENAKISNAVTPAAGLAIAIYVGYNYLIRENFLVKNKAPQAQAWYDAMTEKYPKAHFETKKFVQSSKSSFIPDALSNLTKSCNWFSSFDHIYFSEEALKEISHLYKKRTDGYPLDEKEQLALARHEFILLHEAGHIEFNDSKDILTTIIGLLAMTQGQDFLYKELVEPASKKDEENKKFVMGVEVTSKQWTMKDTMKMIGLDVPDTLSTAQGATFAVGLISLLRYQESRADKFACQLADINTLNGAVTLFENDESDHLYDLENKTLSPFIETNSTLGNTIQSIVDPIEGFASLFMYQILLMVKSMPVTRWAYDFTQDMVHQGPSIRAQAVKNELTRRKNDN